MNILITGGASGLGAAIVEALAMDSANTVYFTYSRSAEAAKQIETALPNTRAIHCDFADNASVEALLARMPEMQPDVLVNNAYGSIHIEHFHKTDPAVFADSFALNILPVLRITQEAIKIFRKKKSGRIINILTSFIIGKPPAGLSSYTANKAYMLAMSNTWATEGIKFNITSNCISPSYMQTNLNADTDERVVEQLIEAHPLKKLLTTTEAAEAVVFFTRASQHANGANLVINAGVDIA